MRKLTLIISVFLIISFVLPAFAVLEFQQRELIHLYIKHPQGNWDKLTKVNKKLVDANLLKMVKNGMYNIIKASIEKNEKSAYLLSSAFIYANLADYLAKKLKIKGENNRLYLVGIHDQAGRTDVAVDICNNILMTEPDNLEVMIYMAMLFERMKMPFQAFNVYQKILKIDKNNKMALYREGILYLNLAKYKDAVKVFKKLLKVDPKNIVAKKYVEMYEGKIKIGKPLDDKNEKAVHHFILGERLFSQGKFESASQQYSNAIENDPHFTKAYVYLGATLMRMKKYTSAVDVLKMAIVRDKKDPEAYHYLGLALEKQFNFNPDMKLLDKAIECYKKAGEVDPDYIKAINDLARATQRRAQLLKQKQNQPD
ncbi:MAG: tetratricopeptide repeat protein [Candidatus Eremiobacteraeota bacterium]|nr:tetratricopeptide repeat protein [Candidatus Eremiobacteraeota bacterium]